jgi:hypothetical protein
VSQDRHAEHRRVDPERYGDPLARPPLSSRGRAVLLMAGVAVVVVIVLVVVLLSAR